MRSDMVDISGMTFGRLTVLRVIPKTRDCVCDCSCGTRGIVTRRERVRSGYSRSCGCLSSEVARNLMTTHGGTGTPEFKSWQSMLQRCTNPKSTRYEQWGGRGITVCERWTASFVNFFADMGPRPNGKSLDRINNDGNYEPGNVRWATAREQAANRRHAGRGHLLR